MPAGLKLPEAYLYADRQCCVVEDFLNGAPANWTATAASGTVAALTDRPGGVSLTTQAADNAPGTLVMGTKIFNFAAGKPIHFAALVQFAEAATSAANVFVGLTSGAANSQLADNGAGLPASYSGVGFYKVDGQTLWSVETSVGSLKSTHQLSAGAGGINKAARTAGSSSYQLLEIDVVPKTATKMDVIFKIDGQVVMKHTDFVFTGVAVMAGLVMVKSGSSTAEVIKTDLVKYAVLR